MIDNNTIATVESDRDRGDLSGVSRDSDIGTGYTPSQTTTADKSEREQAFKLRSALLATSAPPRWKRPANLGEALSDTQPQLRKRPFDLGAALGDTHPQPRKQPSDLGEALRVIQSQPGKIEDIGQALRHAGKGDESDESTAVSWNEAAVLSINTAGGTPLAQQDPKVLSRAIGKFIESGLKDLSEEERAAIDKYVESLAE
jgi:hypothetical protein